MDIEIVSVILITISASAGWRTGAREREHGLIAQYGFKFFGASFAGLGMSGLCDIFIESENINLAYRVFGTGLLIGFLLGFLGQFINKGKSRV